MPFAYKCTSTCIGYGEIAKYKRYSLKRVLIYMIASLHRPLTGHVILLWECEADSGLRHSGIVRNKRDFIFIKHQVAIFVRSRRADIRAGEVGLASSAAARSW